mmetsp:Transcript_13195/g.55243  ORF Transcript_13195/g.55243 Transcript_13195/m.55243 type:complete len:204 (-) Transcript_13195:7842-8453(-)
MAPCSSSTACSRAHTMCPTPRMRPSSSREQQASACASVSRICGRWTSRTPNTTRMASSSRGRRKCQRTCCSSPAVSRSTASAMQRTASRSATWRTWRWWRTTSGKSAAAWPSRRRSTARRCFRTLFAIAICTGMSSRPRAAAWTARTSYSPSSAPTTISCAWSTGSTTKSAWARRSCICRARRPSSSRRISRPPCATASSRCA